MPNAPYIKLPNGKLVTPQHYLQFEHTLESIQNIISHVSFSPSTPIFADKDDGGVYLQAGIIGEENYPLNNKPLPKKIVYGRKWRIDHNTPTSEIIQTAFLAIKKIWEHEIREFFTLTNSMSGKTSTPFSSHHDLPLIANNYELVRPKSEENNFSPNDIKEVLNGVRFKKNKFIITDTLIRKKNIIIDITIDATNNATTENDEKIITNLTKGFECSLVLQNFNPNHFLYALMDALIVENDKFIEENFSYCNFARFSRKNSVHAISSISLASRLYTKDMQNELFSSQFKRINYDSDASKVPSLGKGILAEKNRKLIEEVNNLTGHMPTGFYIEDKQQVS